MGWANDNMGIPQRSPDPGGAASSQVDTALERISLLLGTNAPFVNVEWYGAKHDNAVTNDTAAIQAAIDSVAPSTGVPDAGTAKGGVVYFPKGRYLISTIDVYPMVTLRGAGWGTTILTSNTADSELGAIRITTDDVDGYAADIVIEQLFIHTQTEGSGIFCDAIPDFDKAYWFDGAAYTDRTVALQKVHDASVDVLADTGDFLYLAKTSAKFYATQVALEQLVWPLYGTPTSPETRVEYWNGAWTNLPVALNSTFGGRDFNFEWSDGDAPGWAQGAASTIFPGTPPADSTPRYWIRIKTLVNPAVALKAFNANTKLLRVIGLNVRDCGFTNRRTAVQLMKAYSQNCCFERWHVRNMGSDVINGTGNSNRISEINTEGGSLYGSQGRQEGAIRWRGDQTIVRDCLIEGHNFETIPYFIGGTVDFGMSWMEVGDAFLFNDRAYVFDFMYGSTLRYLIVRTVGKAEFNHCAAVDVGQCVTNGENIRITDGIALQSFASDPVTRIVIHELFGRQSAGGSWEPRIIVENAFTAIGGTSFEVDAGPFSGNLIPNGNFQCGVFGWSQAAQGGATLAALAVEDIPGSINSTGRGKRLKVQVTAHNSQDLAAKVNLTVTLPSNFQGGRGVLSYHAYASTAYNVGTNRPLVRAVMPDASGVANAVETHAIVTFPSALTSQTVGVFNLEFEFYCNSTNLTFYLEDVQLVIGKQYAPTPCIVAQRQWHSGHVEMKVTAMPTTGLWRAGDIAWLQAPATTASRRIFGYLRLTSNDTGFVLDTDWQEIFTPIKQSYTMLSTDNEIGGLTISGSYTQAEIQALRDKTEELADDVRAIFQDLKDAGIHS